MIATILTPWKLIATSIVYFFYTIFKLLVTGDFKTLFSYDSFNDAWFGNFWSYHGPNMKKRSMPRVLPLLQGRVRHGQIYDEVRCAPLSGTVLEVGAGSGMWADVLATVTEGVKGPLKIYGVEPNPYSAAALRKRTRDVGLDGVYEVLPVGIEKLGDPTATGVRVAPGSVDCVVTIQCLCSIPEPEKNARLLYNYLKKGGRWYVYEHIKVDDNLAAISWFQGKRKWKRLFTVGAFS